MRPQSVAFATVLLRQFPRRCRTWRWCPIARPTSMFLCLWMILACFSSPFYAFLRRNRRRLWLNWSTISTMGWYRVRLISVHSRVPRRGRPRQGSLPGLSLLLWQLRTVLEPVVTFSKPSACRLVRSITTSPLVCMITSLTKRTGMGDQKAF